MSLARDPRHPRHRAASPSAASPGQNYHHGVEVNGTVCQTLQHELFICQVDGRGRLVNAGGGQRGEEQEGVGTGRRGAHSLTIPFLCFISLASTTLANCSRAFTV